jgi:nitrogenase iron protein NifH
MEKLAIYGKGGIGKSVVATHVSAEFARRGLRVLHVGCDPKADSSCRLTGSTDVRTVLAAMGTNPEEISAAQIITPGRNAIQCIEAGGPEPGSGCGGRGVARAIELIGELGLLEGDEFDVGVFDVLGDVVCGGFAAPLRQGFSDKVFIVVSEEPMALFAANNICKAIVNYAYNGVRLGGLVANIRDNANADRDRIERFAERVGTRVVAFLERSPLIEAAERELKTVIDTHPESSVSRTFGRIVDFVLAFDPETQANPKPMTEAEFFEFMRT